jgi:Ca2+-binding RTX toxin-like protein
MSQGRFGRRFSLGSFVVAAALIAAAAGASAATTTIGQLHPAPTGPQGCANPDPFDYLQATVSSGTTYVVPADGTITSWSHNAAPATGQSLKFKLFRRLGGVEEYQVVAHDGPRDLTGGTLNTFNVSIAAKAGDLIGFNDGASIDSACLFTVAGETGHRERNGDLADGGSGTFNVNQVTTRLNLTAVLTTPDPNPLTLTATCKGQQATIIGTPGNDVRSGTPGRDVIVGLEGNDSLSGLAGNDVICGGAGRDTLKGGPGNDFLSGQKGSDKLAGQKGKDKLSGKKGKDLCVGGPGKDKAKGCEKTKSI